MATPRARDRSAAVVLLAAALGLAAADCASRPPPAAPRPTVESFGAQTVQAGVTFRAKLDAPLSSETSKEGERFAATLLVPLIADDGSTVAPTGAKLRGQILTIDRDGTGRLVLRFDTVEVRDHFVPIRAQILRIESARVAPSDAADPDSTTASVYPLRPARLGGARIGGGPPPEQLSIAIPRGAYVDLYLSRAIVVGRTRRVDEP